MAVMPGCYQFGSLQARPLLAVLELIAFRWCRSSLKNASGMDETDAPESEFMKSFKVATFELSAEEAAQDAKASKLKPHFWEDVLKARHLQMQEDELDKLGKGKRLRKQVRGPGLPSIQPPA